MVPAGVGRVGGSPSTSPCTTSESENPATGTARGSTDAVTRAHSPRPVGALRISSLDHHDPHSISLYPLSKHYRDISCIKDNWTQTSGSCSLITTYEVARGR